MAGWLLRTGVLAGCATDKRPAGQHVASSAYRSGVTHVTWVTQSVALRLPHIDLHGPAWAMSGPVPLCVCVCVCVRVLVKAR